MSEVNIGAALVANGGSQLSRTEEKLVEMGDGWICCARSEDLLKSARSRLRGALTTCSSGGHQQRVPVAATFAFKEEDGCSLGDIARLDTMVTVVDAVDFWR
jgi:G3E family GTPase